MIGQRVCEFRTASKLSQQDLAEMLNVQQPRLSDFEQGKRTKLDITLLSRIAESLGIHPARLLFGDDYLEIAQKDALPLTPVVWNRMLSLSNTQREQLVRVIEQIVNLMSPTEINGEMK